MSELASQTCKACQGGVEPYTGEKLEEYKSRISDEWEVVNEHHLIRDFDFEDFQEALDFVNDVGEIAEEQGHHPNINFTWGEAEIKLYTHKIDGLFQADFVMAAKIDKLYEEDYS
jgi:4a-hydroxytetrahydrobiopterin dehydratase